MCDAGVREQKHSPREEDPWEDKTRIAPDQGMGWRTLSAAGLQGRGAKGMFFKKQMPKMKGNLGDRPGQTLVLEG